MNKFFELEIKPDLTLEQVNDEIVRLTKEMSMKQFNIMMPNYAPEENKKILKDSIISDQEKLHKLYRKQQELK